MRDVVRDFGSKSYDGTTQWTWPKDYQSHVSTEPDALLMMTLFAASLPDNGSQTADALPFVYAIVKLTFDVEFSDTVTVGPSINVAAGQTGPLYITGATGQQGPTGRLGPQQ